MPKKRRLGNYISKSQDISKILPPLKKSHDAQQQKSLSIQDAIDVITQETNQIPELQAAGQLTTELAVKKVQELKVLSENIMKYCTFLGLQLSRKIAGLCRRRYTYFKMCRNNAS